ncbi:hypothetical protein L8T14_13995 [Enterobacter bugandensis]|uniref:hypothetical protein n=1 Tax=Enterobacter TaxID=547 RepID=UPI0012B83C01|nr:MULTISPECIES: hypothetical protein [Enterobacter]MCK6734350.1 hypothetical protein [Enterobacter bugandensis]
MLPDKLFSRTIKAISQHSLSPEPGKEYRSKDTIKEVLLDPGHDLIFDFGDLSSFSVELSSELYRDALFSDFHFGRVRIEEQVKNLQVQISNSCQTSWVLVTAYYAAFFMATEITKLCGRYIINFSNDDMKEIIRRSSNPSASSVVLNDSNYGYQAVLKNSQYDKRVKVYFEKKSPRVHVEVWKNIAEIVRRLDVEDEDVQLKELFLNICDEDDVRWHKPSRIRNDWNYRYSNYYGEKGQDLGEIFYRNIRSYGSSLSWAGNRTLQPHEKNIVASLSYIYHVLYRTIESLSGRLCVT